jgi:hypothetical protein
MFFNKEIAYLYLLAQGSNRQTKKLIQTISPEQITLLQTGTRLIRQGTVDINSFEFERLQEKLTFVRAFSETNVENNLLVEYAETLALIADIIIRNYEVCSESCVGAEKGMGQVEGQDQNGRGIGNSNETNRQISSSSSSSGSSVSASSNQSGDSSTTPFGEEFEEEGGEESSLPSEEPEAEGEWDDRS